jgi:hypothetical protein
MRTVDHLDVRCVQFPEQQEQPAAGLFHKLERHKVVILLITVILAFCARVYQLDAAGFSEDEANKVFAIRVYEQGDFTVNSEHPMVMKLLCFASAELAACGTAAPVTACN